MPFFEPGLDELFVAVSSAGALDVAGEAGDALGTCDAVLLCVGRH